MKFPSLSRPSGPMRDPRLRGTFQTWLANGPTGTRSVVGQDANRAQQAINAVQGRQYHTATQRPLYSVGQRLQNAMRNRPTEQAGLPKPVAPSAAPTVLPTRRF